MTAVCLLFGYEETWDESKKKLLNDIHFINKLVDFNVNKCEEKRFYKLNHEYLNN